MFKLLAFFNLFTERKRGVSQYIISYFIVGYFLKLLIIIPLPPVKRNSKYELNMSYEDISYESNISYKNKAYIVAI